MKVLIIEMIDLAVSKFDYDLIEQVRRLIDKLSTTANAPSDWRGIGEDLEREYESGSWAYEQLELWNYSEA